MESRTDLVRLLEEMDKVLESKKRELAELDDRLEVARDKVGQKEASEIKESEDPNLTMSSTKKGPDLNEDVRAYIANQKMMYEQQLADFAEQLSELEAINQKLRDENRLIGMKNLHAEDKDQQIESAYSALSENYQELYRENARLRLELAQSEAKSGEQQNQLDKSNQLDRVLEEVYNNKLESLKRTIELKDKEIDQLRADNQFTLEYLGITSVDQFGLPQDSQINESNLIDMDKRQRVIQIAATMREKDSQIELLKSQLLEATKELEKSAALLESITNQQKRTRNVDAENQLSLTDQLYEVNIKCESLELELLYKEQRITELERRNQDLEFMVPEMVTETLKALALRINSNSQGSDEMIDDLYKQLSHLLNEINTAQGLLRKNDELKELLRSKDIQILQLVDDLNQMHSQFSLAVRGIKAGTSENGENLSLRSDTNEDDYKSVDNKDEPCDQPLDASAHGSVSGEYAGPRAEEQQDEQTEAIPANVSPPKENTLSFNAFGHEKVHIGNAFSLQRHVRQLEEENELLELAMKEILLCIKWSDSQCSTLLIDCPSLERLCQIIEARYVAGVCHLPSSSNQQEIPKQVRAQIHGPKLLGESVGPDTFQFVLLKSELDLLRGQNEQLRADIKTQRREYQELLSNAINTRAPRTKDFLPVKSIDDVKSDIGDEDAPNSGSSPLIDDANEKVPPEEFISREAECQTELTLDSVRTLVERVQSPVRSSDAKNCQSCSRASETINFLIQSIVRLETRVTISDDNYMARFKNWNQLIHLLSRDLSDSAESLKELRKECHILRQQKYQVESKLELMENQVVNHLKSCPKSNSIEYECPQKVKVYTTSAKIQGESIESATIRSVKRSHIELPTTSARVIITLLKSIIGCLQARLVFKDERIRQLETLITQLKFCAIPA